MINIQDLQISNRQLQQLLLAILGAQQHERPQRSKQAIINTQLLLANTGLPSARKDSKKNS